MKKIKKTKFLVLESAFQIYRKSSRLVTVTTMLIRIRMSVSGKMMLAKDIDMKGMHGYFTILTAQRKTTGS